MMRRILSDRPLTRAEISARHRANRSPEEREAYLSSQRVKKNAQYARLPAEEKARRRVRALEDEARRIERGGCKSCGKPATHGLRCEFHFFKMFVDNHRMTPKQACVDMLRDLWREQGGRCALTGEHLAPGTAGLDHKVARVRGGTNCRSNLQWVLQRVNEFKSDQSVDELIELCRKIVAHADGRVVPLRKV